MVNQGSIIKFTEGIKYPMLVVSKDIFNELGVVIACPVVKNGFSENALHIPVKENGIVLCEQLRLIDLSCRFYKITGNISTGEIMNITDAIQGIFDYI